MKKKTALQWLAFFNLLLTSLSAEISPILSVMPQEQSNTFFRSPLELLETVTRPTHFILSGYLRKSMTIMIYPKVMAHLGIEGEFLPYELPLNQGMIDREAFVQFLAVFRKNSNLETLIVSDPYKQIMIDYVDELSPIASTIRAVNFVYKKEGKLIGDNMEARAFLLGAKEEIGFDYEGHSMIFFGCGGVSSAVACALAPQLKQIGLVDIDPKKQQQLADTIHHLAPDTQVILLDRQQPLDLSGFDILYNGTGLGKFGQDPNSLMRTPLQEGDIFPSHGLAIDANYTPWQTLFLKQLSEHGLKTLNGFNHMLAGTTLHLSFISDRKIAYEAVKELVSPPSSSE